MGMYCKKCRYDLRGQDTPRCPECGRAFDPNDPRSFLDHPGRYHRFRVAFNKIRGSIAIILTSIWLPLMILGPPCLAIQRPYSEISSSSRSVMYTREITTQRKIWQYEHPELKNFDRRLAIRDLRPRLSPYTEPTKLKWRNRIGRAVSASVDYAIPTAIYALLMLALLHGGRRWVALGVLIVCIAIVPASGHADRIEAYLVPGSHAYLDDYVFIDGVDLTPANIKRGTTIIAYDRRSFEGDRRRIIGFADGHVEQLWDDQAKPLFEANGLEYPAVSNPTAEE